MADFHELLNKLRIEKGVTQEEVATAIGVAKSTFAKYDRGEREPNFETLKKIAQYFQTTTDYLLGLSEVMHPDKTRQLAISVPLGYDLTSTEEEVIEIAREFLRALGTISVIPVEQKEKFTVLIEQTVQVMRYALSICDYDDLMGQETAVEMVIGTWEWFLCPFCSKKLAKVSNQTKVYNFLIYCRHCKHEVLVNWHGKTQ